MQEVIISVLYHCGLCDIFRRVTYLATEQNWQQDRTLRDSIRNIIIDVDVFKFTGSVLLLREMLCHDGPMFTVPVSRGRVLWLTLSQASYEVLMMALYYR